MIKYCFVVEAKILKGSEDFRFFFKSATEKCEIAEGTFYDLFRAADSLEIVLESESSFCGKSSEITSAGFELNRPIEIELFSPEYGKIGFVRCVICSLQKEIADTFCGISNEMRLRINELKVSVSKLIDSKHSYEKCIGSLTAELKNSDIDYRQALSENQKISEELLALRQALKDAKIEKQSLIAENLSFQTEICELHSTIWEKERILKTALLDQEQKMLGLTTDNMLAKRRITELESVISSLNILRSSDDIQITSLKHKLLAYEESFEKVSAESNVIESQGINDALGYLQNLLTNQCISLCALDANSMQIKTSPKKSKEESKLKAQSIDERFLEYLKIYGLENEFERIGDELYSYSNKKVSISVKNDCLVCRVGGGYMGIDEFLKGILYKQQETEEKSIASIGSPSKSHKGSAINRNDSHLKENMNTPSPKRLRIPTNLSSRTANLQAVTPISRTGKIMYK